MEKEVLKEENVNTDQQQYVTQQNGEVTEQQVVNEAEVAAIEQREEISRSDGLANQAEANITDTAPADNRAVNKDETKPPISSAEVSEQKEKEQEIQPLQTQNTDAANTSDSAEPLEDITQPEMAGQSTDDPNMLANKSEQALISVPVEQKTAATETTAIPIEADSFQEGAPLPKLMTASAGKGMSLPTPHSAMTNAYQKQYIGGYINKLSGARYHHASTQTTRPEELQKMLAPTREHREAQTAPTRNMGTQSVRENAVQSMRRDLYISSAHDTIVTPGVYETSEQAFARKTTSATKIQCWVRTVWALRLTRKKRLERDAKRQEELDIQNQEKLEQDQSNFNEIESRLHPKTKEDFQKLIDGLEKWRKTESQKIDSLKLGPNERLTALAALLDQEAMLIQKIDKLRFLAKRESKEVEGAQMLDTIADTKKWKDHKGEQIQVETSNIIRARQLKNLYVSLKSALSEGQRVELLDSIKTVVREFDCTLTREINDLCEREVDLLSRGRHESTLEGLRQRIANRFLLFSQTPEFNPEAANFSDISIPLTYPNTETKTHRCRVCNESSPSTNFNLSTNHTRTGTCKTCLEKERLAMADPLKGLFQAMLRALKSIEHQGDPPATTKELPIDLMFEPDLSHLILDIWHGQSVLSPQNKDLKSLRLIRWYKDKPLSPWNCFLVTDPESLAHDFTSLQSYPRETVELVEGYHRKARSIFGRMMQVQQYIDRDRSHALKAGKIIPLVPAAERQQETSGAGRSTQDAAAVAV